MATVEHQAQEFMRNFKTVHLDTHCDREDCHGTHVDRLDWEIALRRCKELGTPEVMAALSEEDRELTLWVAYVNFVYERYTGSPALLSRPAERQSRPVVIPPEVAELGLTQEVVESICWLCDEDECRICNRVEGSCRIQRYVLRERGIVRRLTALNNDRNMQDFFALLEARAEDDDDCVFADD